MVGAHGKTQKLCAVQALAVFCALSVAAGCSSRPTLEDLEDQAIVTGDWEAVEHREERTKEWLEKSAPHCTGSARKVCVEEQTGIECYCVTKSTNN